MKYPIVQKAKIPWYVSSNNRTDRPTIIDARGMVVAQIMNGGFPAAERIVKSVNRAARLRGQTEI